MMEPIVFQDFNVAKPCIKWYWLWESMCVGLLFPSHNFTCTVCKVVSLCCKLFLHSSITHFRCTLFCWVLFSDGLHFSKHVDFSYQSGVWVHLGVIEGFQCYFHKPFWIIYKHYNPGCFCPNKKYMNMSYAFLLSHCYFKTMPHPCVFNVTMLERNLPNHLIFSNLEWHNYSQPSQGSRPV